jgi:hypothetical protein
MNPDHSACNKAAQDLKQAAKDLGQATGDLLASLLGG